MTTPARQTEGHSDGHRDVASADRMDVVAVAELPTRFGDFKAIAFTPDQNGREPLALVLGNVAGRALVPVRVHSECRTGDVFGSLRCDCGEQLAAALERIGHMGCGILIYLPQEGRGIGLANKIRAYALQDQGHNTFAANRLLGFRDDERDYGAAARMLDALHVRSIRLMTNNPEKLRALRANRIRVAGCIPLIVKPNGHNAGYLAAKERRAGHWLSELQSGHEGFPRSPRREWTDPTSQRAGAVHEDGGPGRGQ
jgi:GTP cyclohydrolase II